MECHDMQYIIFVEATLGETAMFAGPVEGGDRSYFVDGILPIMRPLSDNDYLQGPVVILNTLARFSYILYRNDVYWCIEWDPGLVVVRFSLDGTMAWTALQSPNPEFAGRTPSAEETAAYDEDAENHQYNLVFNAWDAQFDKDWRKWRSFKPADEKTKNEFNAAVAHVNSLGKHREACNSKKDGAWFEQCKRNIWRWCGDGHRVSL
jgi:hypothetical protein